MSMPTTFDNHALIFALIVCLVFFSIGFNVIQVSGKKAAQRQREEWARTGGIPEHAWVDNSASFGANVVCSLWCATGAYLAVAILWGNLFWLGVVLKALGIMH